MPVEQVLRVDTVFHFPVPIPERPAECRPASEVDVVIVVRKHAAPVLRAKTRFETRFPVLRQPRICRVRRRVLRAIAAEVLSAVQSHAQRPRFGDDLTILVLKKSA